MRNPPSAEFRGIPLKGVGKEKLTGRALKWDGSISFLGDVDPQRGVLTKDGSEMYLGGKVLVFREGSGSTVGSYVVYNLRLFGHAPLAMVMSKADAIITIGCILADIPLVNGVDAGSMDSISTGDTIEVDPSDGTVKLFKERKG